jgi:hypothetical protein
MITSPAWIARYDEGMITGFGLYMGWALGVVRASLKLIDRNQEIL